MDVSQTVGLIALFSGIATFFILYAIYAPVVNQRTDKDQARIDMFGEQEPEYETGDSLGKYVRPVLNNFLPQLPRLPLSADSKKSLQNLIVKSGNPWKITPDEFVGLTFALGILGLLIGAGIAALDIVPDYLPPFVLVLFMTLAFAALPYSQYNTKKQARTKAIEKELPEALDLLVITIKSGQVFEFALENVTKMLPSGMLRTELTKVVVELQAGSTLERALVDLRTKFESEDMESFTKAVIQTSKLGSDVTETLTQQANFVRENWKARVERKIARLETTIFIPLVATMLPAFMVTFIAPTMSQISGFLF
jgi:tight adherence protein C